MLYLVECQIKDRVTSETGNNKKSRSFISPFPEGTAAADKTAAVRLVIEALGGNTGDDTVSAGDKIYFDFHAKPKKWESYPTPMSQEDMDNAFEEELLNYALDKGYDADYCMDGIRVKTGVDVWIIDIRRAYESDAHMILYHRNSWGADSSNNSRIPGFHIQKKGVYSIRNIFGVMESHKNKWKPKHRRAS